MPISGRAIPIDISLIDLASAVAEILRRGIDGTVPPLFVDATNQRVVIGGTSVSASPAKAEVTGGDIKVVTAGSGVIVPNRAGTAYYRIIMENDGAISADPL